MQLLGTRENNASLYTEEELRLPLDINVYRWPLADLRDFQYVNVSGFLPYARARPRIVW